MLSSTMMEESQIHGTLENLLDAIDALRPFANSATDDASRGVEWSRVLMLSELVRAQNGVCRSPDCTGRFEKWLVERHRQHLCVWQKTVVRLIYSMAPRTGKSWLINRLHEFENGK
jgi:hypothetical protein